MIVVILFWSGHGHGDTGRLASTVTKALLLPPPHKNTSRKKLEVRDPE